MKGLRPIELQRVKHRAVDKLLDAYRKNRRNGHKVPETTFST